MIKTTTALKEEFARRAKQAALDCKCLGDGAFHAEIAIIAEAPGDKEVDQGRPLIGGSGTALWNMLRKYNINRNNVYVTNVAKRQVSFGQDKRHPINKHEQEVWNALLDWELSQLPNLKYILVLGNMSLRAITGHDGITKWRGSVLENVVAGGRQVSVMCTYNPAMVLREPKTELTFNFDLGKFNKLVTGKWSYKPFHVHINPTLSQVREYLDHIRKTTGLIGYDIETIANETACVGIAENDVEAMCINFRTRTENRYSVEDEIIIRRDLQNTFNVVHDRMVAQNNAFDSSWLWFKDKIHVPPIHCDTMLAHHALYPQLPHNLGYLTTQYTTRPFYKDDKDTWREGGDIDSFWIYNGQDCCNTVAVAQSVISELKQSKLDDFFFNHVMKAQPHLLRMTVGGVKVDTAVKGRLTDVIGQQVQDLLHNFHQAVQEATGDPAYEPNPKSPKQLSELLFTKLKLVGRGVSTDAENRKRMYSHIATTEPKRKVIRALDEYITQQKFFSTYVTTTIDDDGRIRCNYNQTGVQSAPGRLSSSGMLWKNEEGIETGANLQNQPERAYEMYIADQGYGLGYFDLAQAEARLVACFANIEKWLEQFEKARLDGSYDAHRALASEMFHVPYNEVPTFDRYDASKGHIIPQGKADRDVTLRFVAKRCRHGLNYRMMADRLASTTGLSLADATTAYRAYHRATPELQTWWADLEAEVRSTRMLFNAYGRRFIVLERLTPEALESIVAFKPQSTLGDHVVSVIYKAENDPRWPSDARMWLNIHDALIVLAPRHKIKLCLSIAKKYAEEPILITGVKKSQHSMIIPADCKIGKPGDDGIIRWSGLKSVDIEAAK